MHVSGGDKFNPKATDIWGTTSLHEKFHFTLYIPVVWVRWIQQ